MINNKCNRLVTTVDSGFYKNKAVYDWVSITDKEKSLNKYSL